jgi:transposase
MEYDPEDLGYTSTVWTVPLLRKHLKLTTGAIVSDDTLRRYLHEQGEHWKRPRYTLDPDSYKAKKSG